MADGPGRTSWAQTSLIACILANANRDPKKRSRPYTPADFDPYAEDADREDSRRLTAENITDLKMFVPQPRRAKGPPHGKDSR